MTGLLGITSTREPADALVRASSTVRRTFDHRTQDSGNVSWLVEANGVELFLKSAGPRVTPSGAAAPYLDHAGRVRLLENAIELARSTDHPALARLRHVVATATGPLLVYDAAPGELLWAPREQRDDPGSAHQRFARLPADRVLAVLDVLIDVHVALAEQEWVACDLYDGCLLLAPDDRLTVVDLDTYHRGPFTNTMGRMFGSERFMAPEELQLGATIDQRTTVLTLARLAAYFGTRLTGDLSAFVGPRGVAAVLERACRPEPDDRYPSVAAFAAAWQAARDQ